MSIKRIKVDTYKEILMCDDCQLPMKHDGMMLTSAPPQFRHYCPKCGKCETTRGHSYPALTTVEVEEGQK